MSDQTDIERIIENQLSDLTLPCDMRDIRIRMAGAVQQCLAGKDAEIARLEAQLKIGTSIDNNGTASPYMGRTADEWLSIDRENVQLRAHLAEAESELKGFRKEKFEADSGIHPEYQRGVSDERRRSHSDIKTIQAEKVDLIARQIALESQCQRMRDALAAVNDSEFGGIECKDVNGQNWFDARKTLLSAPLDLELLNAVIPSVQLNQAHTCSVSCTRINGEVYKHSDDCLKVTKLLKSLSPAP